MHELTVEALLALPAGRIEWVERPDGTRLRCLVSGEGSARRTVVLAHGILSSIQTWNHVGPELVARGFRVITFDQRGHGRSTLGTDGSSTTAMAGDYRAVLEHFDVQSGVLVGHSMGAYLAAMFCVEHADFARSRLAGLVLVSGNGGVVAKRSPLLKLQVPFLKYGIAHRLFRSRRLHDRLSRILFGHPAPHPAYLEVVRQTFIDTNHRHVVRILDDMLTLDHYERIATIALPTEIICGKRDATCPPWCSRALSKIPGAKTTWLPDAAHMVNYEAPQSIIDAVCRLADAQVPVSHAGLRHATPA